MPIDSEKLDRNKRARLDWLIRDANRKRRREWLRKHQTAIVLSLVLVACTVYSAIVKFEVVETVLRWWTEQP